MQDGTTLGTGFAASTGTALASPTLAATNGSEDYYVIVWLRETNSDQTNPDAGKTFTGTVSFTTSGGSGVTSTFTS